MSALPPLEVRLRGDEPEPRAMCFACRRPKVVCFCDRVVRLETQTRVIVLQHPRERDVPVNTARLAALSLPQAELHVGLDVTTMPSVMAALHDPARPAALLYPGEGAIDVEAHPPPGPITLVVVDGTWWQTRKLVRESPELARLPRYAFRPAEPSHYRIRAEPHEDCLSTIEAMSHVLGILEGDPERFRAMLAPFSAMVERQLEYAATGGGRKRVRKPRALTSRSPTLLEERPDDLVCVHAEVNAWPFGTPERDEHGDELVQWIAVRLATGEVLERFVRPRGPVAPNAFRYLSLTPSVLDAAVSHEALFAEWAAFSRPSDVVCSWGTYATRIFERAGGTFTAGRVDVREAARRREQGRIGAIEHYLARVGRIIVPLSGVRGRAADRMGALVELTRSLSEARTA